jgi:hypothetical protein
MENILKKTIKLNYQNQCNIKGEIKEEKKARVNSSKPAESMTRNMTSG